MRYILTFIFYCQLLTTISAQISDFIHVDQFGYSPSDTKVAVISDPQTGYNSSQSYTPNDVIELRDYLSDNIMYTASPSAWKNGQTHTQSGDRGWWFDFSSVSTPGLYYIYDPINNERSAPFHINANPYARVLLAASKMFYYNRCNAEKDGAYVEAGFSDAMNFNHQLQDANCRYVYDQTNEDLEKDLSGGWFDAGDNNKYITFAHDVIHNLCGAYEDNPSAFNDSFTIPESGDGLADILNEMKWELDWLMKMSNSDGTVHIKMGNISYDDNASTPPSTNTDPRYYGPICSAASIATASMLARAAIVFQAEPSQQLYADSLRVRAEACWDYFLPRFTVNDLDYNCDDGTIKSGDADWNYDKQYDAAVIASMYLFELTGESAYEEFFLQYYQGSEQLTSGYWGPYLLSLNEALLRYASMQDANSTAVATINTSAYNAVNNNWEDFYLFTDADLYRAYVPNYMYSWGSNQTKSNLGVLCKLFDKYDIHASLSSELNQKALEHVHYMHGVNPLGLVMLSNMYGDGGDRCVDEIYHFWFNNGTDWDNVKSDPYGPAPGFLTGGPNASYSGNVTPPAGQPTMKSYAQFNDGFPQSSWEITEPAIYYQAAYLRLLSYFVTDEPSVANSNIQVNNNCISIFPNPTTNYFTVSGLMENYSIQITNSAGSTVDTIENLGSEAVIDVSYLPAGTFFITVQSDDHAALCVQKIIKE